MTAYPDYLHQDPLLSGKAGSYWLATAKYSPRRTLERDVTADVVVVGAGLAGALAAYELSRAGMDVVVLERDTVLSDVTGHTTAKVTAVHGSVLTEALGKLGERAAGRHAAANHLAVNRIVQLTASLGIDCDLALVDTIAYVEDPEQLSTLAHARDALLAGALEPLDIELDALGVRAAGAFRIAHEARFHPVRFGAAIIAAAEQAGARVYEHSRATRVDDHSDNVRVTTPSGTVTADHAVIATNYPFHDHGSIFSRLYPYRSYVLGAYIAQELPDRNFIALDDGLTLRLHPAEKGSLVIASGVHHKAGEGGDERDRYQELERVLRERYDVLDIAWHWSTQDNHTPDALPFIGRSPGADRTWIATGFAAWGMSQSVVAAEMLTDLVGGKEHPLAELYDPGRFETGKPGATFVKENVDVTKEYASGLFSQGGTDEIPPGEGRRVRKGLHRVAAYRDYDGNLHEVSAACTHVGCGIEFNDAEKTWDCPCHGSRFTVDGRVIHGPAVRDLEPR